MKKTRNEVERAEMEIGKGGKVGNGKNNGKGGNSGANVRFGGIGNRGREMRLFLPTRRMRFLKKTRRTSPTERF